MFGAIIGDIAGSRFEWNNIKTKDFEFFSDRKCEPTDDSIMTLAVARAILDCDGDYSDLGSKAVIRMQELGRKYPDAGYGGRFSSWLLSRFPEPYLCCGFSRGSALSGGPRHGGHA